MAKLITHDGVESEVFPADTKKGFTLAELYKLIGTDIIQVIQLADRKSMMIMDEEGKLKAEPQFNAKATKLLQDAGGLPGDVMVGNVVICNRKEFQ